MDCTSKGQKEGPGGRVAFSYGKGVVICEPYKEMPGAYVSNS